MSPRRKLDPDAKTVPLTIKVSAVLLADVRAATTRTGQSLGEWIRAAMEQALVRGGTR